MAALEPVWPMLEGDDDGGACITPRESCMTPRESAPPSFGEIPSPLRSPRRPAKRRSLGDWWQDEGACGRSAQNDIPHGAEVIHLESPSRQPSLESECALTEGIVEEMELQSEASRGRAQPSDLNELLSRLEGVQEPSDDVVSTSACLKEEPFNGIASTSTRQEGQPTSSSSPVVHHTDEVQDETIKGRFIAVFSEFLEDLCVWGK
mmetsp:Transcript_77968/g.137422  ORF Transcript_77968/g.137422 Transcript_77968/m.137422 type:complete len:206 (-) Transcript_77968:48-665(-)